MVIVLETYTTIYKLEYERFFILMAKQLSSLWSPRNIAKSLVLFIALALLSFGAYKYAFKKFSILDSPSQKVSLLASCPQFEYAFGIFDGVGLYQKNGRIEEYGLDVYQNQVDPVKVNSTQLRIQDAKNLFIWFPDHIKLGKNIVPEICGDDLKGIKLIVGIVVGQETYVFHNTGGSINAAVLPDQVPDDIKKYLANPSKVSGLKWEFSEKSEKISGIPVPGLTVADNQESKVQAVFLIISHSDVKNIEIKNFSIRKAIYKEIIPPTSESKGTIKGEIKGARIPVGGFIKIRTEDNKTRHVQLNLDQQFVCDDIPEGSVISIAYSYKEQDYYTQFGRWFEFKNPRENLLISLEPDYINTTGKQADPKSHKFVGAPKSEPQDNLYAPHSRQYWNGLNTIQCYQGLPFTNNLGYLDRDRFPQKQNKSFRILHLGGSTAVALQVKTYEKYNIVLEQELGLRLGRPVEVISIGRDNGDLGTHFKRLKFFIEEFKPDIVLLENMSALMMQIQPDLLKRAHGFDFKKNIFPHFAYDETRKLQYVELSPEYALYTSKPDLSELTPGVPLWESLKIPFEYMHPSALEAWDYLADIFMYYQSLYPNQRMALHTGVNQAQSKPLLKQSRTESGIPYGMEVFIKNMDTFCKKRGILNFNPKLAPTLNHPDTLLTFSSDGHYSVRGHQWLARELASLLEKYIRSAGL